MKRSIHFFKTIGTSLNPSSYGDLIERSNKSAFKYYFSLIYLAFIVSVLIFLPFIGQIPNKLDAALSHFDQLEVNLKTEMNSRLVIPFAGSPLITIDTRIDEAELTQGKVLVTDKNVYYRPRLWGKQNVVQEKISKYENLLQNKENTIWFLTSVIFLMMPTLVFLLYAAVAIKGILLLALELFVALVITRIARFYIGFNELLRIAIYSATPGVVLFLVLHPLYYYVAPEQWVRYVAKFVPLAVSLLYFIVAVKSNGVRETPKQRNQRKRKGKGAEYVELKG
ncbi:DUF1189 family protein [Candidatus Woesearchaeota archaeon]|nr:DUF1189 family protein [Candidatus Woesearchaeota archaeon]